MELRDVPSFNTERIDHLIRDERDPNCMFFTHYGDMTDSMSLVHVSLKR